jgi:hypothetical protein
MFRRVEFPQCHHGTQLEHGTLYPCTKLSPDFALRVYPHVGERVPVIAPYSEVMLHFGLAGKPIEVSLEHSYDSTGIRKHYWAQVWLHGRPFSSGITTGEAGFYEAEPDEYYTYADPERVDCRELFVS